MNCPICKAETKYEQYGVEYIITEEYNTCTSGCKKYYYEYEYGFSKTVIGEVEVNEKYTDTEEEKKLLKQLIDGAISREKEKLKNG